MNAALDISTLAVLARAAAGFSEKKVTWWEIVAGAGPMVKFVLLLLAGFSIMCWAIIVLKYIQFRRAKKANAGFMEIFWGASSLDAIYRDSRKLTSSPLAQVFRSGYQELAKIKKANPGTGTEEGLADKLGGIELVERALRRAHAAERSRLERYLSFLATTGSSAPFVGLFGTVWGIMTSFREIAELGDVGLEVVAPGISEALIATAAGLAAAIPAVIAYNYFLAHARSFAGEMENFSSDILNIIDRHFL